MSRMPIKIVGQSFILAAVGCVMGLVVNFARSEGIEFIRSTPYNIYVPCPMMPKEAKSIEVQDLKDTDDLVFVDARPSADYDKQRIEGSRSVPYNPLKSPPKSAIEELKALGPNRIIVVGDTEIDSGRLFAAELAEAGCLGVRYLKGGFPAWKNAGKKIQESRTTP